MRPRPAAGARRSRWCRRRGTRGGRVRRRCQRKGPSMMAVSTGAAIVLLFGVASFAAGVVLAVLIYRLDCRERGRVNTQPEPRATYAVRHDERRPHAA